MDVFVLNEINVLSSGEKGFYVTLYETEGKALVAMENDINNHIESNGAEISDGEIGDWSVQLTDENDNEYYFEIEVETVK